MKWQYLGDSNGDLLVVDAVDGRIVWRDYPEGRSIEKAANLPEADGCVVLVARQSESRPDRNLWRYDHDRGVVWRAVLPQSGPDAYVNFELAGGELVANSWSGYRVTIDLDTGQIAGRVFTR